MHVTYLTRFFKPLSVSTVNDINLKQKKDFLPLSSLLNNIYSPGEWIKILTSTSVFSK